MDLGASLGANLGPEIDKTSIENLIGKKSRIQIRSCKVWGGSALRTNTPNGDNRTLTRLKALHYRAEGTVADIYLYIYIYI